VGLRGVFAMCTAASDLPSLATSPKSTRRNPKSKSGIFFKANHTTPPAGRVPPPVDAMKVYTHPRYALLLSGQPNPITLGSANPPKFWQLMLDDTRPLRRRCRPAAPLSGRKNWEEPSGRRIVAQCLGPWKRGETRSSRPPAVCPAAAGSSLATHGQPK